MSHFSIFEAHRCKQWGIFDRKVIGQFQIRSLPPPQAAWNTLAVSVQKRMFLVVLLSIAVLFNCPVIVYSQEFATGDPSIVSPNTKVELLFDGASFTEGPAVAPDGRVYFSDVTMTALTGMQAGHIWRYDPKSGQTVVFRSPSGMSNGIIFDLEGRMVVVEQADFGGRRITRTDMTTGKSTILAGLYNGRPFNSPNDLVIDESGRIYFTDPRYLGHEPIEQPVMGVYRIDPDKSVHLIITDAGKPNGILISPDQKTLYVSVGDNGAMGLLPEGMQSAWGRRTVLAYDLAADGTAKFRKVLIDVFPKYGVDGMAIDVDGNLYITAWPPRGIWVFSPEGKELSFIPTPEDPRNAKFGHGSSNNILYITAGRSLYRIKLNKAGYNAAKRK